MSLGVLLALAIALAMDTFAVSIGVSLAMRGCTARQTFRLALHFGFFQFVMPIVGWAAGRTIHPWIEAFDHWVAAGLLVFIGGKMILEALERKAKAAEKASCPDQTRGGRVLLLALATSLDSLAVGLGLAALGVPVLYPAAVIGLVTFGMTALGVRIGPLLGRWAGKGAELAGGLVLLVIAAKILVDHLS